MQVSAPGRDLEEGFTRVSAESRAADPPPVAAVKPGPERVFNRTYLLFRTVRPHILLTYDDFGEYGHPDHIQAHRVLPARRNPGVTRCRRYQ